MGEVLICRRFLPVVFCRLCCVSYGLRGLVVEDVNRRRLVLRGDRTIFPGVSGDKLPTPTASSRYSHVQANTATFFSISSPNAIIRM